MSKLFLVPTPIGNLKDITYRAVEVLGAAELILAEDTRQAKKLLMRYNISAPVHSHHMFNEHKTVESVCDKIASGISVALISDAGTPGISDPGFLLVRACIDRGLPVESLPGATALIPALVNSGLPSDRFVFEGFIPVKKGRNKRIEAIAEEKRTIVLYESPYRLVKTLEDLGFTLGSDREASVSRELTKVFEETIRGSLSYLAAYFKEKKPRGEFVIVVSGKK
jgi:16S rRNA (cytidine1402-2'-O)-methyltransferase